MVVKRTHRAANVAPAIMQLREQINTTYPKRDKASDGIWPSAAHSKASPNSDHEAGNALDIDDDLLPGNEGAYWDVWAIALSISKSADPRVKYIIHDDRIWYPSTGWRNYTGSNPHRTHMHISVFESKRNDKRPWSISQKEATTIVDHIYQVCVKPSKAALIEKFIKDNKMFATKTVYRELDGKPSSVAVNPVPFRPAKKK